MEFSVGLAEFAVEDSRDSDEGISSFVDLVQADRGMRIILQPLPDQ